MSTECTHHIIGVDGGGSGCRAAVADLSGTIIGQATGGPANATTNLAQAIENVRAALEGAARAAGLSQTALHNAYAHVGLAGVLTAEIGQRVAEGLPMRACVASDDRQTSVVGALGSRDGVLLSVGTGTIVAALHNGAMHAVSGWGLQVGDQASGAWLGRGLLERVLLCHDRIEAHSDLTRATLAQFAQDPNAIAHFASNARPADYARFSPEVFAAAEAGDPNGLVLIRRGVDYLSRALRAVGFAAGDVLCLSGGVGPRYAALLAPEFRAAIAPAQGNALDGALRLARQLFAERQGQE